jgi:hypothetical protein
VRGVTRDQLQTASVACRLYQGTPSGVPKQAREVSGFSP